MTEVDSRRTLVEGREGRDEVQEEPAGIGGITSMDCSTYEGELIVGNDARE